MTSLPPEYGLGLAMALFGVAIAGLLARRSVLMIVLCLELLLAAAGLALVAASAKHGNAQGTVGWILLLAMAASELSIGLVLVRRLYEATGTLDLDALADRGGEA